MTLLPSESYDPGSWTGFTLKKHDGEFTELRLEVDDVLSLHVRNEDNHPRTGEAWIEHGVAFLTAIEARTLAEELMIAAAVLDAIDADYTEEDE